MRSLCAGNRARHKLLDRSAEFEILHAFLSKKSFGMEETIEYDL